MITDSDALAILDEVVETMSKILAVGKTCVTQELHDHFKHEFYAKMTKRLSNGTLREAVKKLAVPVTGCSWCEAAEDAAKGYPK